MMIWGVAVNIFKNDYIALQKVAAIERALVARDLELARQIQDSIAPPSHFVWQGAMVRYRYHKHSTVGGDWAAIHVDAAGDVICVVADAMGKGLQAALVVHAVQSLWAESLNEGRSFEPDRWLKSVNRSLFNMGKNATHMVTLGIVKLTRGGGTYWSAGHLPLFLVGRGSAPEVRAVLPIGSPLGILPSNRVQSISFPTGRCRYLMLGTDGVFEKGTRHNRRDIVEMMRRIEEAQAPIAELSDAHDDKTLITVDFAGSQDRSKADAVVEDPGLSTGRGRSGRRMA
jgi:serine phosphatase RsbU (regulator of sigma subunit)